MNSWVPLLIVALGFGGATGCATTTTRVTIDAKEGANGGAPLHMMIRTVPDALEPETYEHAAAMMFTQPQDESIVSTQPIFPGERIGISVPDVGKKDIVIYFFFTTPDPKDGFRVPLRKPIPAEVFIELGENSVLGPVQVRRR